MPLSVSAEQTVFVGARSSLLSQKQVEEVQRELHKFHPGIHFVTSWKQTTGDLDQQTSLLLMEKTDFFTREIDLAQLDGDFQVSIHSAKDLPEPIRAGLKVIAITTGLDSSDVLVLKEGVTLASLISSPRIGLSSLRREKAIKDIRSDAIIVDIRGTILQRLELLNTGHIDGLVVAKAALIRLSLDHLNQIPIDAEIAAMQGRLAVIAREGDASMAELFACIDAR